MFLGWPQTSTVTKDNFGPYFPGDWNNSHSSGLCGTFDPTQGFMCARQALYQLGYIFTPTKETYKKIILFYVMGVLPLCIFVCLVL